MHPNRSRDPIDRRVNHGNRARLRVNGINLSTNRIRRHVGWVFPNLKRTILA